MTEIYRPFQPTLTTAGLKRFALSLEQLPACAALGSVVHSYLQVTARHPTPYPIMPDGTQAIFISPYGSMIGGAQSRACDVQMLQAGDYFGIRFYPGTLRHFFSLDLSEITDQFVDNHYFPCRDFADLHNRLYRLSGFSERAQICEQWLLRRFKPQAITPFDHALSLIYQSFGNIKVSQLADRVGWSSRHLNRLFRLQTGLSTKVFAQTVRIQHVCRQLYVAPGDSLNTAHGLGFFDQPHLLNDYKKRLLSSPGLLFDRFMSDFYNQ